MHRIDTPTAQIDKFGQGKNGFTNGDPSTGRRATDLNSDMWDAVQEEMANAIELTGIALDKSKHNQLYLAIQKAITDPGFLKKANNLSDLEDVAEARGNLQLGTASTKNVGVSGGNVMQVGAFGLGAGATHRNDAYTTVAEIYRVNNTSNNRPGNGVFGVLSLPCDGGPTSGYLAVSNAGAGYVGSSQPNAAPVWSRIYTTAYKPTASDVGAYPITGGFVQGSVTALGNVSAQNGSILINDKNGVRLFELAAKLDGSVTFTSLLTWKGFSIDNNGHLTTYLGSQLLESGQRVYSPNNLPPAESSFSDNSGNWISKNKRSGMIMQGGIINRSGDVTNVTFPAAFPGTCSAVFVTQIAQSGASSENIIVSSRTLTGCTLIMRSSEAAVSWMAIGA